MAPGDLRTLKSSSDFRRNVVDPFLRIKLHFITIVVGCLITFFSNDGRTLNICDTDEMVGMPNTAQQNDTTASSAEPMLTDVPAKTEVIPVEGLPLPQTHPQFWHQDGTVVAITSSMLFRVHQATICDQSSVLKALVVLAQAELMTEGIDEALPPEGRGIRYIHLDDDPADVEQLFFSLYDAE